MSIFDLDRLTIGDYYIVMQSVKMADVAALFDVMMRCCTIDLMVQPMSQVQRHMDEFTKIFTAYIAQQQNDMDTPDATRLLRDLFRDC